MTGTHWEVYQQVIDEDPPPEGAGWQPLGCYGELERGYIRGSGSYQDPHGVVVWARKSNREEEEG